MDEPLKQEAQNTNNRDSLNSNEKQDEKEINIDQSNKKKYRKGTKTIHSFPFWWRI